MSRSLLSRSRPDDGKRSRRGADLHSTAAVIEELLALAKALRRRPARWNAMTETERLAADAAIEQVDWLLDQHWEALEDLAADRYEPSPQAVAQPPTWRLPSGVRVRQSCSEALRRTADMASDELAARRAGMPATAVDALQSLRAFLSRHADAVDRIGT